MPFGVNLRNFTGLAFIAKAGNTTLQFSFGIVEEIVANVANPIEVANAAEIPGDFSPSLLSKEDVIATTAAVGSKLLRTNLVSLIADATPNLLL